MARVKPGHVGVMVGATMKVVYLSNPKMSISDVIESIPELRGQRFHVTVESDSIEGGKESVNFDAYKTYRVEEGDILHTTAQIAGGERN